MGCTPTDAATSILQKLCATHSENDMARVSTETNRERPPQKIGTSAGHWFTRGLAGGFLLMAGVNAVSFFFRTGGFGSLLGYPTLPSESIGFPLPVWEAGKFYRGAFVDYRAVMINIAFALIPGLVFGCVGVWGREHFNQWVEEFEREQADSQRLRFQFSTKTLLVLTTVVALAIAAISSYRQSRVTLLAVYLIGPAALIGLAMLPDRIRWYWRALLLVIVAKGLIGIAISTGFALGMPLDKVMFGIFVCWVPQSVFAAFGITVGLVVAAFRSRPKSDSSER